MNYDEKYMRRALQLARNGMMFASPNPMVGAVIVHEGKILVSEEITKATIAGLANGDLAFRASVIQAGGFKTVEEAWAAMAAK